MLAFGPVSDHLMVYGRQLVMWVILLVAVTPGGSGVAEIIFPAFLGEFLPQKEIAGGVAFVWRFLSYYPYIIIGSIVFPIWLRRIRKQKELENKQNDPLSISSIFGEDLKPNFIV